MEPIALREYARQRGVSLTAIQNRARDGKLPRSIVRNAGGRIVGIIPELANEEWPQSSAIKQMGNRHAGEVNRVMRASAAPKPAPAPKPVAAPAPAPAAPAPAPAAPPPPPAPADTSAVSYTKARTAREAYNAQLARLEYEERSGKLVNADEVRAEAFKLARTVRDAMMNIPDRISAELVGQTDARDIHALEALIDG
jgi:hypothetical protein